MDQEENTINEQTQQNNTDEPEEEASVKKKKEKRPVHEFDRKGIKKRAHGTVRTHYVLLLFLCLILIFIGTEYHSAKTIFDSTDGSNAAIKPAGSGALQKSGAVEVFEDLLAGKLKQSDREAKKEIEENEENINDDVLGRSRGAFASIVNGFTSGYFAVQIAKGIMNLSKSKDITTLLFAILMFIAFFGIWLFIKLPISVIVRRMFLEARTYKKVPMHHAVFFYSVHKWLNVPLVMLYDYVIEILWWLTIIGGPIKMYSYSMVPYIIAENPDIRPKEAMKLSREMMYCHKWEAFVLDLSLIPWDILSFFTAGVSDLLYGVSYRLAVKSEYYDHIRTCAKQDNIDNVDRLNDVYLFEHADEELLWKKYMDIASTEQYVNEHPVEVEKWQRFFIKNFGIWIGSTAQKNEYQKIESMRFQVQKEKDAVNGDAYPRRLNPLYNANDKESKDLEGTVSAFRCYTIWSLILMFFAFSIVGWLWEVSLHIITDGVFVNRGTMHGPWLPIYGYGGVYILVFLNRLRKNVFAEFLGAILLSGFVEYMTSLYLEMTQGMRWWDYTGYFLNLNGRICGEGLLVFGLGGLAIVYLLAPLLDSQFSKIKNRQAIALCLVLLAAFNIDGIYTKSHPNVGKGITDYGGYKEVGRQK